MVLYIFYLGPIYLPIDDKGLKQAILFLEVRPGKKYVDLGSGDGRTLIAIAKAGGEAHGFEFNPVMVLLSRWNIRRAGLDGKAFIHFRSFWRADISQYSGVIVFGIPHIMRRLEKKLTKELPPGTPIASHVFKFPTLKEIEHENGVYLYKI